jgi:hypothetical protein
MRLRPSGPRTRAPSGPEKEVLLNEIQKNIDDSLRMTRRPASSLAEIYMGPDPDRKRTCTASPSRTGHYVKKKMPGKARTS